MQLGITTLGRQAAVRQGQPVRWPSRAAQRLFYLLLAHPEGVSRDTLLGTLWRGDSSQAKTGFKVTHYRLRQALGDPAATVEREGRLALAPAYYQNADHIQFQDELRRARSAETPERRLHHTYRALSLYGGDFLPDCSDDWAEDARSALRAAYVRARIQAAALHCEAVECESAVRHLATGLGTDPLAGEQLHRNLMTCLWSLGRADDATSHYRHFLSFIQRDVGDLPTQATLQLAEQIRKGEPHAAQCIGTARPCPRRLLYGPPVVGSPARPLDLTRWETEVRRGRQMLALMHKLKSVHGWQPLTRVVQGFLGTQLGAPYVWLVPYRPVLPPAPAFSPQLEGTGWPAPVTAAFQAALAAARGEEQAAHAANSLAGGVAVHLISDHSRRQPYAWLAVARAEGAPAFSSSDAELLARVAEALAYFLAQARWAAL